MNITLKRILILFSVALNVGFVIATLIVIYNHPQDSRKKHIVEIETALKSLNLETKLAEEMLMDIRTFHHNLEEKKHNFHKFRINILSVLAIPGPVDTNRFEAAEKELQQMKSQMHKMVRTHILEIREKLGDENGARFFQALKKEVQSDKKLP